MFIESTELQKKKKKNSTKRVINIRMKCPYKSVSTLLSNAGCVSGKINLCMQMCSVCSGERVLDGRPLLCICD